MHPRKSNITCSAVLLLVVTSGCNGFTSSSKRKSSTSSSTSSMRYTTTDIDHQQVESSTSQQPIQNKPKWIPMELVELVCEGEDLTLTPQQFIRTYADIEAYTGCDDEGDDFHECDFFEQFLGPTKWVHLTPQAQVAGEDGDSVIGDVHYKIWKDVWKNPSQAVDLADKVSKECLRYYKEFMLEPRSAVKCPTDRPVIRVKVVPASYGLEGFEDAVWEATEDLMTYSSSSSGTEEECCKAITFVVAAPDLFTDPSLLEGASPQAEFEPERFQEFSSTLREKMVLFSKLEGIPLDDDIQLTPFHPLWKFSDFNEDELNGSDDGAACPSFPYPCVAVSAKIEA